MDFSAMWLQKNKLLSGCTRVSPLLTAYSEGSLPPAETARVAAHLSLCPSCAKEAEDFATLSVLLRANPPKAALPAPDLWLRLEAQIRAEGGGTVSEKRRAPNLRFTPVFGTMAAAALVGGAVMLTLPLTKPSKANKTRGLDAAQVASTVTREKHRLPLDTSAGIIEAAKQEAVVAAVDQEMLVQHLPTKRPSRNGYQTGARTDPFVAARQSNQPANLPDQKPFLSETPPKRKSRPVQVALVKQSSPRPAKTAAMGPPRLPKWQVQSLLLPYREWSPRDCWRQPRQKNPCWNRTGAANCRHTRPERGLPSPLCLRVRNQRPRRIWWRHGTSLLLRPLLPRCRVRCVVKAVFFRIRPVDGYFCKTCCGLAAAIW